MESLTFAGTMICADGAQIQTDFFKLHSKLHQRAWILHWNYVQQLVFNNQMKPEIYWNCYMVGRM